MGKETKVRHSKTERRHTQRQKEKQRNKDRVREKIYNGIRVGHKTEIVG